jgi:hypothetical protein
MREVRKGRVDGIVAYKLDRLGRSLSRLAQLVGEMTAHRAALVIPAQGIDTSASNPASQLQLNNVESFHPFRYCEASFRFNERKDNDQGRFIKAISGIVGKGLKYAKLIAAEGDDVPYPETWQTT